MRYFVGNHNIELRRWMQSLEYVFIWIVTNLITTLIISLFVVIGDGVGADTLANERTTQLVPRVQQQRPPSTVYTTGRGSSKAVGIPIPVTGDQKLLILLVDFPDRAGLFTGTEWRNNFFFGTRVRNITFDNYYKEVSYGKLRYTGDIVGVKSISIVKNSPDVAYIRLPNPLTYYADGNHGYNIANFPRNIPGVTYHALQKLDTLSFDFAPYATKKQVRNVIVIYAGSDGIYTGDSVNSLRSTSYKISWSQGSAFTSKNGGYVVDDFTFCHEQEGVWSGMIAPIGNCVHEHGHSLGMYDLYDVSSTTTGGVGLYDVMGYGFYALRGATPFHFGAFSKEYFGWIQPTVVPVGTTKYRLLPSETKNAKILKLYPRGDTTSFEYFLIENRQPIGFDANWNTAQRLCQGIFIWHIDTYITTNYPYVVNAPSSYNNGTGPPHRGVIIVEADGRDDMINSNTNLGDCSDRWNIGQTWNDTSIPNSRTWNNRASGLSVSVVSRLGTSINVVVSVTSINDGSTNLCSYKPSSPVLIRPSNGFRTWLRRSVTLKWSKSTICPTLTTYYWVWVRLQSANGTTIDTGSNLVTPSFKTKKLPYGKKYYWTVTACNTIGCTYSSSYWYYFRIG